MQVGNRQSSSTRHHYKNIIIAIMIIVIKVIIITVIQDITSSRLYTDGVESSGSSVPPKD